MILLGKRSIRYSLIIIALALLFGRSDLSRVNAQITAGFLNEESISRDFPGLSEVPPSSDEHAKSIILMIGDGMGAEHRKAAQYVSVGSAGTLTMDDLEVVGYLQTYSADDPITDSAAAATAMATGVKTNNGVIGLDPNLNFIPSILEQAQDLGKSVGLVTTTQIYHATPAAFAAHLESRYMMNEIAEGILSSGVDVLLGGGEDEFLPGTENGCYPEPGERTDGRNLINEAVASGYAYVCDVSTFGAIDPSSTNQLLGLFADEGLDEPYSPSLADMVEKAIDVLSNNPNGFFLLVEGGQIDWAAHNNDAEKVISDTISFDDAVEVAKNYSLGSDDILVIVTADHETGGMTVTLTSTGLPEEDGPFAILDGGSFYVNWTTTGHTAANVPVTAFGPFSDRLTGVNENTYIYELMLNAFCYVGAPPSGILTSSNPCGAPEMDLQGGDLSIIDGDSSPSETDQTDFSVVAIGGVSAGHTFTIENIGDMDLYLTGSPIVDITGPNAGDFSLTAIPSSPVTNGGGMTNFEITFNPGGEGILSADVNIINNDADENPYNFTIQGTGMGNGDTIGIYIPGHDKWYLKNDLLNGWTDIISFNFGGAAEYEVITGDWDNDGLDTAGFYVPSQKKWYLKNNQISGWNECISFRFGISSEVIPVAGDWNNDGVDTVGFYIPSNGKWYLKNNQDDGWTDFVGFKFEGLPDSIPIAGDWNGDGGDSVGFYVPSQKKWYLKNILENGWQDIVSIKFGGSVEYKPITGDWDNDGVDTVGFYVPSQKKWYLKNNQVDGWIGCLSIKFGVSEELIPVAGDWH